VRGNKRIERRFKQMRFNFRKIASVIASAVMLGSTVGIAAAASYPEPFVKSGMADVAVVYGSSGAVSDLSASIEVQTHLNTKVTSTSGSSASSTGGDSVNLASSSQDLYVNSSINAARNILTKDHLPTLLADGSAYDQTGTEYKYTQTITPGTTTIGYSKSGESIDPDLMVNIGYQASSAPFYTYTLTFNRALNVSSSDVIGNAIIRILGKDYTVGANSDSNTLYLYVSGTSTTVEEGETSTVSVDGKDHTISMIGSSSTTSATFEVDGIRRTMTTANSYRFADGFEVYFKSLFHSTKTGSFSSAELLIGSRSLHFEDLQAVRYGSEDTSILGTYADISATGGSLTQLIIKQAAESSIGDYIKAGQTYTDRVFGNLMFENVGSVPTLDDETRDSIVVNTDQSVSAKAKFTSALANDEEYTLTYARDADNTEDSTLSRINLAYENGLNISYYEGQNMKVGEYIIVNDNDEGRIFRISQVPTGTSVNDYAKFDDVITGESFSFTTGIRNSTIAAVSIGGAEYHAFVTVDNSDTAQSTVKLHWGASANETSVGTQTTLFPRIKLKNGEWMSFLTQASVTQGVTYSIPGEYLLTGYKGGETFTWSNATTAATFRTNTTVGNVVYSVLWANATGIGTLDQVNVNSQLCNFNYSIGPAILINEEKTLADANGHAICIPLTNTNSGTTNEPAIGVPLFSDTNVIASTSWQTLQSDSYKRKIVDTYGTFVERNTVTGSNNEVTVSYPDEQMYIDVFFKSAEATITPGTGGSTGGGTVLIVKDTEVDTVSGKNLIIIGGSCINTAARKIVDPTATAPICGSAWTAKTNVGPGQYLLKAVESPWNEDKTAMLVAGYEAPQTISAVAKLKEGHASDVGTSNIYPVTSA
jgi:hypothetical protein